MAGIKWQVEPAEAWPAMAGAYVKAVYAGVHGVCQKYQAQIENYMKANKVWTDRTANAVQGLYAAVEPVSPDQVVDVITVIMAHSMYYGYYLEGWNPKTNSEMTRPGSQNWKIIEPTLDHFGPLIWADIRRVLS